MTQLMVALIGPGRGPKVPMAGKTCVLRMSGMNDGAASILVDDEVQFAVVKNGNYELPTGEYVCVDYEGKSRTLIAEIVRKY